MAIRVTVWNEYRHEQTSDAVRALHPDGIHGTIKNFLCASGDDLTVNTATLDMPEHGLTDEVLQNTDVLLWWGHMNHGDVSDDVVNKVVNQVLWHGMGFIALHSAHHSKPFRALMGAKGDINWGDDQQEIMWTALPGHPIAAGVPDHFILDIEEMYGEPFDIPQPDELVFISWFKHGNVMRSGCCYHRGRGRIFYFQPGHEVCPSYHNPNVQKILSNAVRWAAPAQKWESRRNAEYMHKIVE